MVKINQNNKKTEFGSAVAKNTACHWKFTLCSMLLPKVETNISWAPDRAHIRNVVPQTIMVFVHGAAFNICTNLPSLEFIKSPS